MAPRKPPAKPPVKSKTSKVAPKATYDGQRYRRRLANWVPTQQTTNAILALNGELLIARCRDTMRNSPHANAAAESFVGNLIGTGIKPSSLLKTSPALRMELQELWSDWVDECDADGVTDFYGLQALVGRALFEAGECFIRLRPRRAEDGLSVPLQLQLLESEMLPFWKNEIAPNGNRVMNGVEFDFIGRRAAYWFYPRHPGELSTSGDVPGIQPVRIPADQVLHIFVRKRPGQVRGVPLLTPALVKLFLLDQYDDAELDRKKTAAMYAGFVTSPAPEDLFADVAEGDTDEAGMASLEPGTMQLLRPGEEIAFSEPADVGGSYELFQYRQQLAVFSAMGVPYTLASGDLKRANYSSLRGAVVEYRRRLEQMQFNVIVPQMCRPIWQRWLNDAVLSGAITMPGFADKQRDYSRVRWIPPRYEWVDPLKDQQAEKLAVDAGFKSRSDVIESQGYDPEENDARIAADQAREKELGLNFPTKQAAVTQPVDPNKQDELDEAARDAADDASSDAEAA